MELSFAFFLITGLALGKLAYGMSKQKTFPILWLIAAIVCLLSSGWAVFVFVMTIGFGGWEMSIVPGFLLTVLPPFFFDALYLWMIIRHRRGAAI